jgi:hypothetical protein
MAGISPVGALFLAVLIVVGYLALRLVLVQQRGGRPGEVQIEWNPFSLASRAGRAEKRGRFGEAMLLYAAAGQGQQILDRMRASLPPWPIRDTILAVTSELLALDERALGPQTALPAPVADRLAQYLENAGTVVWTTANRVAAAGTLATSPPRGLQTETAKLEQLLQTVRDARQSLADLTLSGAGAELPSVEQDFRKISSVAESLAAENDRDVDAGG